MLGESHSVDTKAPLRRVPVAADKFVCNSCSYESEEFFAFRWWERYETCPSCQEIVVAMCDRYMRFDPQVYLCTRCNDRLEVSEEPCVHCPHCHRPTLERREYTTFIPLDPAPIPHRYSLRAGRRVHVLRLGKDNGRIAGQVSGQRMILTGELADQPGLWWGEGVLTSYHQRETSREEVIQAVEKQQLEKLMELNSDHITVEIQRRLEDDPRNALDRIELLYPESSAPWLAIDFAALRNDVERTPYTVFSTMQDWLGDNPLESPASLLQSPLDSWRIRSILYTLLSRPVTDHRCAEIHDGQRWHPLAEVDLILQYAKSVRVIKQGIPPTEVTSKEYRYDKPYSVEVRRSGVTLAKWETTPPEERAQHKALLGSLLNLASIRTEPEAD